MYNTLQLPPLIQHALRYNFFFWSIRHYASTSSQALRWKQKSIQINTGTINSIPKKMVSIFTERTWITWIRREMDIMNDHENMWKHKVSIWLVVSTPLKNLKVSWDDDIPNMMGETNVPNHQPDPMVFLWFPWYVSLVRSYQGRIKSTYPPGRWDVFKTVVYWRSNLTLRDTMRN